MLGDPFTWYGKTNYKKDYVHLPFINFCMYTFVPPQLPRTFPYLSLRHHPFSLGGVPLWVETGTDEVANDVICDFASKMQDVPGNKVELYRIPGAPHDVIWCGPLLGFDAESEKSVKEVKAFLERVGA